MIETSGHDPACPVRNVPVANCLTCRGISVARGDEVVAAAIRWEDAERALEERSRKDERATIEKRIRESGIARHLSSHAWDVLIQTVRGQG